MHARDDVLKTKSVSRGGDDVYTGVSVQMKAPSWLGGKKEGFTIRAIMEFCTNKVNGDCYKRLNGKTSVSRMIAL